MLKRIAEGNKRLNAFITLAERLPDTDGALPLAGMTMAVKDNICTADMRTTCASKMLETFCPLYDAHAVSLLRAAGVSIVGKTNMDEFGMGSTGEHSAFGAVLNPVDTAYSPGGSSSGSAAAVAAGLADAALGSDTGGSVRQPASHCGIVGFKPSYGAVSRRGLIAFASSMEQIGILSRNVRDTRRIAEVICSHDTMDGTSRHVDMSNRIVNVRGMRIGVSDAYNSAASPEVRRAVERAVSAFKMLGAEIVNVEPPMTEHLLSMYYILSSAEASSNLARFDGIKYGMSAENPRCVDELIRCSRHMGFGAEVKRRIILGTFVLSEGYYENYYGRAQRARRVLVNKYSAMLRDNCDLFISPVAESYAPRIGELLASPAMMHESDHYTVAANLTGFPAISLPAGKSENGMPVGVQLMSAYGKDAGLLDVAEMLEAALRGGADK